MEVTFKLDVTDLRAFATFLARRRTSFAKLGPALLVWMVIGVLVGAVPELFNARTRLLISVYGPVVLLPLTGRLVLPLVVICGITFVLVRWQIVATYHRQIAASGGPMLDQMVMVSLTPQIFHWRDEGLEMKMLWHRVFEVANDVMHIYILTSENGGFIIPKRAFGDEVTAQRFFKTAHGYWRDARSTPPPIPHPGGDTVTR